MPTLPLIPLLLLLLAGALLPTLVEAGSDQGVGIVDRQIDSERPLLSTNALTPFPDARLSKEERQARKLLRKKKKRLRELREEIRRMDNGGVKAVTIKINTQTRSVARRQVATAADLATGHDHRTARSAGDADYCRCCHAAAPSAAAGAAAAAAAAGVCVRHDAAAAVGCADSCQCTAQLHCFAPKHNNATQPACKRAASSDIVTGTYLNDPDAIF
ncbi:hypothetical protein PRIPAC_90852 [Pristionchus pacificus]|uniref:Uncharacterized protein n=1 Tax=Pristionchus pacificus TaxID=54126 RepID=A0A2A6B5R4_PRIPA|nr:hypothetical protein PRIPAC_90852 [Pristionchus pacificus]|eukprot:PDM61235.1 hypothetical protein PRIPAC_50677 [Pristionchus pacificus]